MNNRGRRTEAQQGAEREPGPSVFTLRPRVGAGVDRFQSTSPDVGVNFRRHDRRVSEHSLYDSQVGAVLQHVSCRAVPEGMRIDSLLDACCSPQSLKRDSSICRAALFQVPVDSLLL